MHNTFRYGGGHLLHFPLFFNTFFCNTIPLFSTEYDSTRHGRYIHEHTNNWRFSDSLQEDQCSIFAGSDGGWVICIWEQHERDTPAWRYGSLISVWLWLGFSTTSGRDGESIVLDMQRLMARAVYRLFLLFQGAQDLGLRYLDMGRNGQIKRKLPLLLDWP
jgi:hypothetical protein